MAIDVGSKVRCIDDYGTQSLLKDGSIYEITSINEVGSFFLKGLPTGMEGPWHASRFEAVEKVNLSLTFSTAPTPADNYTCTRCGNQKLCTTTDKSCWSCGEKISV